MLYQIPYAVAPATPCCCSLFYRDNLHQRVKDANDQWQSQFVRLSSRDNKDRLPCNDGDHSQPLLVHRR